MDVELRAVTGDEFEELPRVDYTAFGGGPPDAERVADLRKAAELDRTRAVFDSGRMVAASAALSLELTLPGLTVTPAAAVTFAGVLPTHRRRGHLRLMMTALLDDAAARAKPVAMRSTDEPELALGVEDLGALYLGGVAASVLAAAGRITELRPGALARADAMLTSSPGPFSRTGF